jgi:hypothetical protein
VGGHGVEGPIHEIEQETGKHFHFEGTEALPIDHFEVVLEGTPEEIEERALPFREGEEVLVHDRGAAHVQRGRRGGEAGRLRHLGLRERQPWWARRRWSGSRRSAAAPPRRPSSTRPRA